MRARGATLVAIAALAFGACAPAAPSGPASPDATLEPSPGASAVPALASELRAAIDADAIMRDLRSLQDLTLAAGGNRAAGSAGEAAADDFVAQQLEAAGLRVTRIPVAVPLFRQAGPGAVEIQEAGAPVFEAVTDFKPLLFSPSGDVTGAVVAVGFEPTATSGLTPGGGCDTSEWSGFPRGSIALVQPGPCRARTAVEHAQAAGAVAMVRSYPDWTPGHVLRPTLLDPAGLTIPVIGVTRALGVALDEAAAKGVKVRVAAETETTTGTATNLIAETTTGDRSRIVMLGSHLDSVIDGPGINDNGSGAMTVLEIARRLAGVRGTRAATAPRVQVAFWSAEELGLLGSTAWLQSLSSVDRSAIAAYLNFDMLGSPNGVREVNAWSAQGISGATFLEALFGRALDVEGLAYDLVEPGGSDDAPFARVGVPTSGLFAGHNTPKSADQAQRFGGVAGDLLDPCYHLACDTVDNLDPLLLGQMARAAGWVTGYLASGEPIGP